MKKRFLYSLIVLAFLLCLCPAFASAEGETYALVTGAGQLSAGDEVLLISEGDSYYVAMTSGFGGTRVTVSSGTVTAPSGALPLTLVSAEGGWLLSTGSGYLAADGSSLTTVADTADASLWSISISGEEAAITADGGAICFDGTTFNCGSGGNPMSIYRSLKNDIFTITWKDYDGTELAVTIVQGGTLPIYPGEAPVREMDSIYKYNFTGWTPRIVSATGDATYTAVYQQTVRQKCGENLSWELVDSSTGVLIISGSGAMSRFSSSSAVPWYKYRSYIRTVILPEQIDNISDYAFSECTKLTSITIPDSVTSIGYSAFTGCTGLTSITIPDGVTSIGDYAFKCCTGLTSITIPDDVTSIGRSAFDETGWWNAQSDGVVYYNDILLGVKGSCGQIVRIKDGTRLIAEGALSCHSEITKITIPNSVTSIGTSAFAYCSGLTSVTIGNGVTSIGDLVFSDCTGLTSIMIPDSVTSIINRAFRDCTGLTSVTIGNSVAHIGQQAFSGCTGLIDVHYHGTPRTRKHISIEGTNDPLLNATWHYLPVNSIEWIQQPNTLTYDEGQELNVNGGQIRTYYDYDIVETEDLTADMVSGFDNTTAGIQTLTVTFGEKTLTYEVTVNHVPGEPVQENVIDVTCTENGSYDEVVYCSFCAEELSREQKTIEALGHDLVPHEAQAATCTQVGWEAYDTCSRCDYTTYVEIPALGHDLVHHEAKAATCTEIGWEAYDTCSRCDYTTYEEIPALGHDIEHHEAKDPTCTEIGWEAYDTCSRCDYTTYAEIPALGHDIEHHDAKAATCTEIGWEAYDTCSQCDYTTYEEIPALGHDLAHHDAKAATCTEIGWNAYYTCSQCDYTTYEEIPALGHDLAHHEAKAATCTEIGWKTYDTCSRCDYTTYEEIPALGHDLVHHDAKAATCTEIGWNAYYTCSQCDYTTYEEIPALGHDLVHHEAKAATDTEIGWKAYDTCSRCDYTTYEEIPALGHQPGAPKRENEIKATCTEGGSYDEVVYCSDCGEELSRVHKTVNALGHDLVHHDAKAATDTEIGWQAYDTCSRCDYTTYKEISARGHQAGAATRENEVKATCTEGGSYDEVVYCSDCGEELSRTHKTVNALGHSPKAAVQENVVPATATQEGSYDEVVYCERCGKELSREKKTLGKAVKGLTITEEPQSATVLNGKKASFTVKTSGTGVSYQWYCRKSAKAKWTKIKKATKATYTVTAKPVNNGYQYKCTVKNASGSLTTNIVTLRLDRHPPVITGQPKSVTADSGTNAVFTVSAQYGKSYQWYYRKGAKGKWSKVKGGTKATLSVAVTSAKNGCQYKCVVKNGDGSVTTDIVKLTVNVHLPVITKQPASVTAGSGTNATFTVSAQYGKSYQWYYRKGAKGKWKKVKKGTKATLSVAATAAKNGYQYRCVVKNGDGSVTTNAVSLTVK